MVHLLPAELDVGTEEVEGIARDVSPASMSSTVNLLELFPTPSLCESVVETPEFPTGCCEDVFAWKIKKDWCVVLIPAKPVTETVYDLKADSTWVFLKENIVAWRTENDRCFELIPAELEAVTETVHDVKQTATEFSSRRTLSIGEQRIFVVLN